jgi:hypothetical protein
VNELLRANLDFCVPSVSIDTKYQVASLIWKRPNSPSRNTGRWSLC